MAETLAEAIKHLARFRREVERIDAEIEAAALVMAETPEWKKWNDLKGQRNGLTLARDEFDIQARSLAIGAYSIFQDKHPHPAVTIKEYDTLTYDQDAAFSYCIEHLPNALKLDRSAFEKAAKVIPLVFVTVGKEQRATIATDLTPWLMEDQAELL